MGRVDIGIPEGCNVILGQSHLIKTVEDSTRCWPLRRRA
jgi:adenosine/AMP kinase